jgi:hypothetical protein
MGLLVTDAVRAADWPQWRGSERNAISQEKGLLKEWPKDGPPLVWSSKVVGQGSSVGRGYSSLAIAGGKIVTMGDQAKDQCYVYCLDEASGKQLWATPIAPAQGDGPRCTPTIDGDLVYALSRQGVLACLSLKNGEVVWKKDFKKDFGGKMMSGWDYSESPTVDGGKLIVTPGGDQAALVALDKLSGSVLWNSEIPKTGGAGYASIVSTTVNNTKIYLTLLGKARGLVAVDADTGKFLFSYNKVANGTANIPTAIVSGNLVFTTTGYGDGGSALLEIAAGSDGSVNAKEVYQYPSKKLQNHHGGVILLGDYLYGGHGHNKGLPFCMELKTGDIKWGPVQGVGDGSAAVVYADGHLYFRYQSGEMALIEANPSEYKVKGAFKPKIGGNGWPHPVIANGRLYLRGDNEIQCYDIKAK